MSGVPPALFTDSSSQITLNIMSRFLPPGGSYPVTPKKGDFATGSPELLEQIGSAMEVRRASTPGRIPSPVSRAYLFYANLFLRSLDDTDDQADNEDFTASAGRKDLQDEARRTLRGLLATFALRDVLNLTLRHRRVRLTKQAADDISQVLVPALNATPGSEHLWNPVRFYTLQTNGTEEVLAGRSPLTGLYPAATPPTRLAGLYWYEYREGEDGEASTAHWYDPTSTTLDQDGEFRVTDATRHRVQQLMKAWLTHVLGTVSQSDLQATGVEMDDRDAQRLLDELQMWRQELANVTVPDTIDVTSTPIPTEPNHRPLPLLTAAVQAPAGQIWGDLPMHDGRLIVTYEKVRSETTRLYGRYFGTHHFDPALNNLPRQGDNLGNALGLGENAIPVPYLYIDELFTPNLTLLTSYDADEEPRGGLSAEWDGLKVDFGSVTEYYLIPMQPKILEIMDPDTLIENINAELSGDGQHYVVRLRFGETTITKKYSTSGEGAHHVDEAIGRDAFDLRLFPNYGLDAVRHLITGAPEGAEHDEVDHIDDVYYARLRLSPTWGFRRADPFALENGTVQHSIQDDVVEVGDEARTRGKTRSTGTAVFYTISKTPDGFFVPERGFCRLDLEDPRTAGHHETDWSVGIDFGTSNTCVAVRNANEEEADPEILDLPVLTTTLLERPNYSAKFGHVFEGASAALDFFYNFSGDDEDLMSQPYFPTQLLTQQEAVESDDAFDIKNGLIYFDNVSLADPTLLSLIRGFPKVQKEVAQRFNLKQDIKWQKTDWLRVFMHHLRKQVVLTAAARNARVSDLHFSYPKSFDFSFQNRFEGDLDMVWGHTIDGELNMSSESEAARDYVVSGYNQHIIFDIGGGTTDIIAFHEQEPIFQTSFRLAAGQVNEYVLDAPAFRKKFIEAIEQRAKKTVLEDQINERLVNTFQQTASSQRDRDVVLQLWLGLLQRITEVDDSNKAKLLIRILNYLRTEAEQQGVIQGFFLTNALLMGGLAYYAGQLLRVAAQGGFDQEAFRLSEATLSLTGNGSRLYNMLNQTQYPFSEIMKRLFRRGAKQEERDLMVDFEGIFEHNNTPAPKVTVALGLLRNTRHDELRDVPVANITAEEGYPTPDGETDFETSLVDFYQSVFKKKTSFDPPREVPANLRQFLDAMGEAMPYGKHGQFRVIPAAHKRWAEELQTSVYERAVPLIKNRGHDNARQAEDIEGMAEEDRPALEPLFVAQLVGLMEAIRKEYAA
jgi:hypothetical protein